MDKPKPYKPQTQPQPRQRKVRFERNASQVVFDPSSSSYVVTWAKCNLPPEKRLEHRKDPLTYIPSVGAVATLYDRGCVPVDCIVYAAMSVARAWAAGDREGLDTESARKAAELVHDLATMCVNSSSPVVAKDVGQAMRHLLDEMAMVEFGDVPAEEFGDGILAALSKAAEECFSIPSFGEWPSASMRRRFLYCLNKKERTKVAYTLVSLLFESGSCPLLSLSDRRMLRMQAIRASGIDKDFSAQSATAFFRHALGEMRKMKEDGRCRLGCHMTSQQLVDSLETQNKGEVK